MPPPLASPVDAARPPSSSTSPPSSSSAAASNRRRARVDSNPPVLRAPDPKRARSDKHNPAGPTAHTHTHTLTTTTTTAAGATNTATMQARKRPEIIDLTRRGGKAGLPAFAPQMGARRLAVTNLRKSEPTADIARYYERTWAELEGALASFLAGQPARVPLERVYRGVEDVCRNKQAEELYAMLRRACEEHLGGVALGVLLGESRGGGDVDMLRVALRQWQVWCEQTILIRSTFSYLDRSYLLSSKNHPQLHELVVSLFRKMIFQPPAAAANDGRSPGDRILTGMCELVDMDRRGDGNFDPQLLREAVTMVHVFNAYVKRFEPLFFQQSTAYFTDFAEEASLNGNLKEYIGACQSLLKREDYRCNAYNFDSTTKKVLLDSAHNLLIEAYTTKLLDSESVANLLAENEIGSMKALYELLRLSGIQKQLREPWEAYIRATGAAIVNDVDRGDEMVVRLLELRHRLDLIIRDSFAGDNDFTYGLRDSFVNFVNDKKNAAAWKTGTSKVGEMIAKYIDMLLRGGLKTLPPSLLADRKDRAAAERSGLSSTGDEDAELDRQLDHGLELFRFIEGKDVFEAFYKKDLARRLLMGRSASQDAERNMLSKLKSECGSSFTHNLEQMFKDQELGRDEMAAYKSWKEGSGSSKGNMDLQVSILSAAAWPTYPDVRLLLPPDVLGHIDHFDKYYKHKHTGRRLTWKHSLAHCVLRASFDKGTKELLVSAFQATVMVLFNSVASTDSLSFDQISSATGLMGGELERTLQSLACGKVRVLAKSPKGKEVKHTDRFMVNRTFMDPKYRVKINQIQLRETKEENKETHERVVADRQFETQAAIVRIMKSRKTLPHAQLVAEVIGQTKSRGAMDPADIKMNIEKLIEKEYLEREGNSYVYLA